MKRITSSLVVLLAILAGLASAQEVAKAEFQGVDITLPHSPGVSGWLADGSVGEARIVVTARDASGNPVAGAPVVWTVMNSKPNVAYVVSTNSAATMRAHAYKGVPLVVDGGVTDSEGRAFIVIDSLTSGDLKAAVTVGGVAAKTYDGGDMRVVWF